MYGVSNVKIKKKKNTFPYSQRSLNHHLTIFIVAHLQALCIANCKIKKKSVAIFTFSAEKKGNVNSYSLMTKIWN
jgi:hypothetical protein